MCHTRFSQTPYLKDMDLANHLTPRTIRKAKRLAKRLAKPDSITIIPSAEGFPFRSGNIPPRKNS